jgi:uncharacterized protein (DUF924 family)
MISDTAVSRPSSPDHAERTERILHYWFGTLDDATPLDMSSERCQLWHAKNPATDEDIRQRFYAEYEALRDAPEQRAPQTARDYLALVILFDQFSRNMGRDTPAMFETDALAVELCQEAISRGLDTDLPLIGRLFLYMPLMHAEQPRLQDQMLGLFQELPGLAAERCPHNRPFFEMANGYAKHHADLIYRFGRFPHRNAVLSRVSTPQEAAFLQQNPAGF